MKAISEIWGLIVYYFKSKRKTVVLRDFMHDVLRFARENGTEYCTCRAEINHLNKDSSYEYEFSCYVSGYTWFSGRNPAECMKKLREYKESVNPSKVEDVIL